MKKEITRTVDLMDVKSSFRGVEFSTAAVMTMPNDPSWFSYRDEENVRERDWLIQPGDLVLDVGAAYGSYAVTALSAGAGHVWAWSPQLHPCGLAEAWFLSKTAELNGWQDRLTLVGGGLYSRRGWLDCLTQEFSETVPDPVRDPGDLLEVQTLDAWREAAGYAAPNCLHWLKLDVEGAEAHVLRGGMRLISDLRPRILVELHRFKDVGVVAEVSGVMDALGYRMVSDHAHHSVSHAVYAPG